MQVHESNIRAGDVLSLKILSGQENRSHLMQLLLKQGVEIEIGEIHAGLVSIKVRAPGQMLVLEEYV